MAGRLTLSDWRQAVRRALPGFGFDSVVGRPKSPLCPTASFSTRNMDEDLLLGGRVRLLQPENGLRASLDAVLLAASVAARPGARVIDLGSGSGVVLLCLAARRLDLDLTGWEIDEALVALANRNAGLNGWGERVRFEQRDILARPLWQEKRRFDHIVSNPPFHAAAAADPSPDPARRQATIDDDLAGWLRAAARLLVHRGRLTLIFRADRLDRLLAALMGDFGDIQVMPLWPRAGQPAKRALVQACRGSRAPLTLWPGIALHGADNAYLPALEQVLRNAMPFAFAAMGK